MAWFGFSWRRLLLQTLTALSVTILAVPLAAYFILTLLFRVVRSPFSGFWRPAPRQEPPELLQDPKLGEHAYVTLPKGIKLHYVHKGDSSRPLMLMLHGFPEFWYSWKYQLQEFSKDYWVVAVDMRGYGDSDKPSGSSNYRADVLVDDVKELLDAFERPRAILVGHGWGGVVGWLFLERYPERVERLVAMGAPHPVVFQRALTRSLKQLFRSWYMFLFQVPWLPELLMRSDDLACLAAALCRGRHRRQQEQQPATVTPDDVEAYKYTFAKPGALTGPINYYRAAGWGIHRRTRRSNVTRASATATEAQHQHADDAPNGHVAGVVPPAEAEAESGTESESIEDPVNATEEQPLEKTAAAPPADSVADSTTVSTPPCLLLVGGRDAYVQHDTAFRTRKFFPNVTVIIVRNANHFVQLDDPTAVNSEMRKFFEK